MKRVSVYVFLLGLFFWSTVSVTEAQSKKKYQSALVGFYNLENLFDTIDDPAIRDEEFLPNGKNRWNTEKYTHKLAQMSKVISKIGTDINPDGLAVLGISEVENRKVVEDLISQPAIANRHYKIVHRDSPDRRGIDVAMIYNPKYLEVTGVKMYRLHMKDNPEFRTRDQMLVSGVLKGDKFYFIINHWPSRYGGEKRSRPLRNAAASLTRHIVDSLLNEDKHAKIIVMGDLNDNPTNESVLKIMDAKGNRDKLKKNEFYNPMYKFYKKGIGTTAWRDTWSLFDQIFLSPELVKRDFTSWRYYKAKIFNKHFMQQQEGKFKGYPYRTFAGGTWLGGYSDHFPVYVILIREAK
jgi:predicted extracellular nuclease